MKVINYINDHLAEDLHLTQLAALIPMSPHYFSSLFKQSVGLSPHQYVIRSRVERARKLLLSEQLSIAEIACLVGFANQSHLNRHFKRWFGMTPKAIRGQVGSFFQWFFTFVRHYFLRNTIIKCR